ncbi:MAG: hypothetical protein NVSMB17_03220 [Candidatus Dormibacteria bacterium]
MRQQFATRAELSSRFAGSYVDDLLAREQVNAMARLSDPVVSAGDFERVTRIMGFEAAVLLDDQGHLLQVVPANPAMLGAVIAPRYPHLARAETGKNTVSPVTAGAATGRPLVGFAVPFESSAGRRVFSGGFDVERTPLGTYLINSVPYPGATADLVDAAGKLVASSRQGVASSLARVDPLLARAVAASTSGTAPAADAMAGKRYFVTAHPAGTPWTLVTTIPEVGLYSSLEGARQWIPWVVLVGLVGAALYVVILVGRLADSRTALEARVFARTAELSASNQELEAFTYSVSHDLRAPLRAMAGFATRVQAGTAALGDPELTRYSQRITANAEKMGQLIDQLLTLSRLNRLTLQRTSFLPSDIARRALEDLAEEGYGNASVTIADMGPCKGDPALVQQVYTNLLSNALKYSRNRAHPVVEVGSTQTSDAGTVYFVRDNGAGFDMRFKDKLFGVFQRLHGGDEFEGIGVGLSIVKRIVTRHGGNVFADGTVDGGATFSFTLGG